MRGCWTIGTLVAALLLPAPVHACSCIEITDPLAEMENADLVFEGQVLARVSNPGKRTHYRVKVLRNWKGAPDSLVVTFQQRGSTCDYSFRPGSIDLFYAHAIDGVYETSLCSRSAPASEAHKDYGVLGKAIDVAKQANCGENGALQEALLVYLERLDPLSTASRREGSMNSTIRHTGELLARCPELCDEQVLWVAEEVLIDYLEHDWDPKGPARLLATVLRTSSHLSTKFDGASVWTALTGPWTGDSIHERRLRSLAILTPNAPEWISEAKVSWAEKALVKRNPELLLKEGRSHYGGAAELLGLFAIHATDDSLRTRIEGLLERQIESGEVEANGMRELIVALKGIHWNHPDRLTKEHLNRYRSWGERFPGRYSGTVGFDVKLLLWTIERQRPDLLAMD